MVNAKRIAADVHAHGSWLVGLDRGSGELWRRRVAGPPGGILDALGSEVVGTELVYEAGPTGFALARAGLARGLDVRVCAPGSLPRAAGDRVKTDRRDAERLLRAWQAGQLAWVRVPSEAEEAFRDLVRAREAARGDLMRQRHRLSKLLLRWEQRPPARQTAWTGAWLRWARQLSFDDPALSFVVADQLAEVEHATDRRARLDHAIRERAPQSPFADVIGRLRCFRGIDTLTAAGLAAEIADFSRFARPEQLTGYLGIVPSEHSSGERQRRGPITRAGSGHARRLLVEAAHHYRHRPRIGVALQARQAGQDPRVIECAWRAQHRLHRRFEHLRLQRGKPANVVTVALARELVAFCWEATQIP